jgi:hypothetical protein
MAPFNFLLKRTGTLQKRPDPNLMALGELNLNYNQSAGGLYYKDTTGAVRKVGPAHVGPSAPNGSPTGSSGHSVGEMWYDTSAGSFKVWGGSSWAVLSSSVVPEVDPFGRMYWDGNITSTPLSPQNTWKQFSTGSRSLQSGSTDFALDTSIVGLRYTGTVTKRVVVTAKGRFDPSPNTSFKFAIARTSTGTSSFPADIITDSTITLQDTKLGETFMLETVISVSTNDVIYPALENTSSSSSVTIKNASLLIRKI